MSITNYMTALPALDDMVNWLPAMKAVFWIASALLVVSVLMRSFSGGQARTVTRAYRVFFALVALMFAGVLAYQATWQLAGFARPEFVEFMKRYNRRSTSPVANMVRGAITDAQGVGLAVDDSGQPGRRTYPAGSALAHIVGYHHPLYGLFGVEAADHAALSGVTRDSDAARERFRQNLLRREPLQGNDTPLTLIASLQREVHGAMQGRKGAVVALDPASGAILCLYSSPAFDPNNMTPDLFGGRDPGARMINRALQGLYPAGSTFKVLVAAAALDAGLNPRYDCPAGGVRFGTGNRPIRDHEYYDYERRGRVWPGHGTLAMREALAKSSNIYFARLGVELGGSRLIDAVTRFGINRPVVIMEGSSGKIAGVAGRFPALSDDSKAKTAQISIGQGEMVVTPLHMAMIAAVIGRQGQSWAPRLDARIAPQALEPVMSASSASTLAGMMRHAVQQGTGRGADIAGLQVAGKTGTAQNPHGDDHSWFIGIAPVDAPVIAFAVLVEQGGYGSRSAVPVAAALLKKAKTLGLFDAPSLPAAESGR